MFSDLGVLELSQFNQYSRKTAHYLLMAPITTIQTIMVSLFILQLYRKIRDVGMIITFILIGLCFLLTHLASRTCSAVGMNEQKLRGG